MHCEGKTPSSQIRQLVRLALFSIVVSFASIGCVSVQPEQLATEYYRIGSAFYELERYSEALEYYALALEFDPQLNHAEYNIIRTKIENGAADEAINTLTELLEETPENVELLETLAYAYYRIDRFDSALEIYRRVLDISEYRFNALYNSMLISDQMGDDDDALSFAERAYLVDDDNLNVTYIYADLLYKQEEDQEQALRLFDKALQNNSLSTERRKYIAGLYEEQELYIDALDLYSELAQSTTDDGEILFSRAKILLTYAGEPAEGLAQLDDALKLGFNDMDAINNLLDTDLLLERDRVVDLLTAYNISVASEESAADTDAETQPADAPIDDGDPADGDPIPALDLFDQVRQQQQPDEANIPDENTPSDQAAPESPQQPDDGSPAESNDG